MKEGSSKRGARGDGALGRLEAGAAGGWEDNWQKATVGVGGAGVPGVWGTGIPVPLHAGQHMACHSALRQGGAHSSIPACFTLLVHSVRACASCAHPHPLTAHDPTGGVPRARQPSYRRVVSVRSCGLVLLFW